MEFLQATLRQQRVKSLASLQAQRTLRKHSLQLCLCVPFRGQTGQLPTNFPYALYGTLQYTPDYAMSSGFADMSQFNAAPFNAGLLNPVVWYA